MNKREDDLARFKKMEGLLACPICAEPLRILYEQTWVLMCGQRHTFDIAREGYVNLLTTHRRSASGYGQVELVARRRMLQGGLFAPLVQHIAQRIREDTKGSSSRPLRVVDVGTGEGTVFSAILSELTPPLSEVEGCGTDISVAGIRLASKLYTASNLLWVVSNALRRLPFRDHSAQVLLSILAPMSWEEASRILAPGGWAAVVTPGEHHLCELRDAIFEHDRKPRPEKPRAHDVASPLALGGTYRITHTMPVPSDVAEDLIHMSPLFWKASRQRLDQLRMQPLNSITVDFEIDWLSRK